MEMETRRRTQDGNRGGNGDGDESSSGDGNGDEDGNGYRNENGIRKVGGQTKKRKKPHRHCRRDIGTFIPHASSSMQTESSACGHPTDPFPRPGACTRASHLRGNRVRGTGRGERGRGRDRSWGRD